MSDLHSKHAFRFVPEWMVWEILRWVPTKSLMRFKTVSKLWLSIIQSPNFAKAHQVPFRGLLITDPTPSPSQDTRFSPINFFYADLNSSNPQVSLQFSVPEDIRGFGVTDVVNGLVCFYHHNSAKICNIATHEIRELPASRCAYKFCAYHFGFDSTNKVYKLLKICPVYAGEGEYELDDDLECAYVRSIECELLTLGVDSSWRTISPPAWAIRMQAICINGVLYWWIQMGRQNLLVAFDLAQEKFHIVPQPDQIHLKPYNMEAPVFGKSLALMGGDDRRMEIQHFVEDTGGWAKSHIFHFPKRLTCFGPVGMLPDGRVVVADVCGIWIPARVFLYDESKRDLQEVLIGKSPSLKTELRSGRMSCYEENIITLRYLIDIPSTG